MIEYVKASPSASVAVTVVTAVMFSERLIDAGFGAVMIGEPASAIFVTVTIIVCWSLLLPSLARTSTM